MPLASVQEWRARIGTCWCALGRPIKSQSSRRRREKNCYGCPPPGGGKRVTSQDGPVSVVIMFVLMVIAMLTLWNRILDGFSPVCTSELVN